MVEDRTHRAGLHDTTAGEDRSGQIDPSFVITHPAGHAPNVLDRTFEARSQPQMDCFLLACRRLIDATGYEKFRPAISAPILSSALRDERALQAEQTVKQNRPPLQLIDSRLT